MTLAVYQEQGIDLWLEHGELHFKSAAPLTNEQVQGLRANKANLLKALQKSVKFPIPKDGDLAPCTTSSQKQHQQRHAEGHPAQVRATRTRALWAELKRRLESASWQREHAAALLDCMRRAEAGDKGSRRQVEGYLLEPNVREKLRVSP